MGQKKKIRTIGVYTKNSQIAWMRSEGVLTDKIVEKLFDEYKKTDAGKMFENEEIAFWIEM